MANPPLATSRSRLGARGGARTHTALRPPAPKAGASANSATLARDLYAIVGAYRHGRQSRRLMTQPIDDRGEPRPAGAPPATPGSPALPSSSGGTPLPPTAVPALSPAEVQEVVDEGRRRFVASFPSRFEAPDGHDRGGRRRRPGRPRRPAAHGASPGRPGRRHPVPWRRAARRLARDPVPRPRPGASFDEAAASRLLAEIWSAFTEERTTVASKAPPRQDSDRGPPDGPDRRRRRGPALPDVPAPAPRRLQGGRGDEGGRGLRAGAGEQAGGHPARRADAGSGRLHHRPPAQGPSRHGRHPADVPDRPQHRRRSPRRAAHRRRRLRVEVRRPARAGAARAEAVRSPARAAGLRRGGRGGRSRRPLARPRQPGRRSRRGRPIAHG